MKLIVGLALIIFFACQSGAHSTSDATHESDVNSNVSVQAVDKEVIDNTIKEITEIADADHQPASLVKDEKKISEQPNIVKPVKIDPPIIVQKKKTENIDNEPKTQVKSVQNKIEEDLPNKVVEVSSKIEEKVVIKKESVEKEIVIKEESKESESDLSKVKEEIKKPQSSHNELNTLLQKYVRNGVVDYTGLLKDKEALESYIAKISKVSPKNPKARWSKDGALAYWINLYNASTLKMILDNYPVKSIMDLHGGKPWDKKWIVLDGGDTYSLNQIENDIIRPEFNDARIHFAVNCAAKSCPPLANFAFDENRLHFQLETVTKAFINSNSNTITPGSLEISKIFEWYAEDFGNLRTFFSTYAKTPIQKDVEISYKEYDWSLNGK